MAAGRAALAVRPAPPGAGKRRGWTEGRVRALAFLVVTLLYGFVLGYRLDAVRAPVWDEAYYLTAEARVHAGRVQFASHPPLGLLLIAAGEGASGLNREVDWRPIAARKSVRAEDMPPGFDWRGPRLAAAVCGALAAGLFFLLMARLANSTGAGLMLTPLLVCDPALVAQFRAGQLDAFQIVFILAALHCGLGALEAGGVRGRAWCWGFGGALMLAAMVRANALALAPLGLLLTVPPLRRGAWAEAAARLAGGFSAALLAAAWVFALMLAVSPLPPDRTTPAGRIDAAHVSRDYARTGLAVSLASYGADYAAFMAQDLAAMARSDANASHPAQWLAGAGAITYRWDASGDRVATVALVPNRAAWLVSLAGVLWAAAALAGRRRGSEWTGDEGRAVLLLSGWLLMMAALVGLDTQRVMYAYHYFIPLLLGHGLAALAWRGSGLSERIGWPVLALVALNGALALPLALHQPVPRAYRGLFLADCGATGPAVR